MFANRIKLANRLREHQEIQNEARKNHLLQRFDRVNDPSPEAAPTPE